VSKETFKNILENHTELLSEVCAYLNHHEAFYLETFYIY